MTLPTFPLQANPWSETLATVLAVWALVVIGLVILYNRYNRDDLDPVHAAVILSQLHTFGGTRDAVLIKETAETNTQKVVDDIRALFEPSDDDGRSFTRATREIGHEMREEIRERTPEISTVPARALQESFLTALFGAIAMVPIAVWRDATKTGKIVLPTFPDVVQWGVTGVNIGVDAVFAFPLMETMWALALSFGIIGTQLVWDLWWALSAILAILAVTYWILEIQVETDRSPRGPRVREGIQRSGYVMMATWFTGTSLKFVAGLNPAVSFGWWAPYTLAGVFAVLLGAFVWSRTRNLKYTGFTVVLTLGLGGSVTALIAAVAVAGHIIRGWAGRAAYRWGATARTHGRNVLALDLVHSLTVIAAAVTFPFMLGYIARAITSGKILQVAQVIAASRQTYYAVLALVGMIILAVIVAILKRSRGAVSGMRRAMSIQAVRTAMWARGFPVILTITIAIILLAIGIPWIAAVTGAIATGIIGRLGVMAFNYITFRYQTMESEDPTAARVVVNGREVKDADGDPVYIAAVNGHRIAHRRLDALITQILRDARGMFRNGSADPGSWPRYYYKNGILRGKVETDVIRDELIGDIRSRFRTNVKEKDPEADTLLEKLREDYPDRAVEGVVRHLKQRGRVSERENRFYWHGE